MSLITEYVILSVLGTVIIAVMRLSWWRAWPLNVLMTPEFISLKLQPSDTTNGKSTQDDIRRILKLADYHETAARLADLIHKDGADSWPPRANHVHSAWPVALRPYKEIYREMAPLLPAANVSLDDELNRQRIDSFRSRFETLLHDRVNLKQVTQLLDAADAGRWDVFPRDIYNAFYCCIAWCRHAYRWGTIPVVSPAQLEKSIALPPALTAPWASLQAHFGLASDAGNMMSNIVLNFSPEGEYTHKINTGLSATVLGSEEEFARICNEMEALAVPVYHAVIRAVIAFSRGDKDDCLARMQQITARLRPLLSTYYDRVHDGKIARAEWLSRVQGFYAWGAGREDASTGEWTTFDGLSGNQVLLFQVLDAFLGLDVYLSKEVQERNVPVLQREFCAAVARHTFRHALGEEGVDGLIRGEFAEIVKRLRLFRSAHRTRAKFYLTAPAPERLPMTAGKSLLKGDMDESLQFLDAFMVGRLQQTV
ncbi:hypothetical protein B0T26DRAFT_741428 [Lasiosphaeria miniovina]|uniref:Indoleamine 2,3-dioxygenase n=1 Tax=Lasiosphaeria miniovina TaxID=1954250 RepID=A0AA40AMJ0_9PEZI|nr:uncharacterized protein B0T26DRAFT_741428 [Lasiosphaeria miniovina]KAK0718467.1 hypothetical protein B0T26DRAFT_741428 [Lasiosphaeria miniovina]